MATSSQRVTTRLDEQEHKSKIKKKFKKKEDYKFYI